MMVLGTDSTFCQAGLLSKRLFCVSGISHHDRRKLILTMRGGPVSRVQGVRVSRSG